MRLFNIFASCISYFSIAVTKHCDQDILLGLWFQRVTVHDGSKGMVAGTTESSQLDLQVGGREKTVNSCEIKKQITYFQHIMAQNIHFHSKMEDWEHSEEILDQRKMETQSQNSNPLTPRCQRV